jgi:carbon monoxide dehydrogenase subunit G
VSTVNAKTRIQAPVEQVWDTVMDPSCLGDWVTIHRSVEDVSAHPLRQGSTMKQCLHLRGVSFNVNWKLVDLQAPNHAEWEGQGPAHSVARIRYELRSDGDDATEFEYINEFTPPGGRLGSMASRMIVGAASEREAERSLKRLKALVEQQR